MGPYGDWVNFDLDQRVLLIQEIDGEQACSPAVSHLCVIWNRPALICELQASGSSATSGTSFCGGCPRARWTSSGSARQPQVRGSLMIFYQGSGAAGAQSRAKVGGLPQERS